MIFPGARRRVRRRAQVQIDVRSTRCAAAQEGTAPIEATIDPARIGQNEVHFYLFDRKTGAPFEGTDELRVAASMPARKIEPIELSPYVAGPGHYVVDGATLSVTGDWTVTVVNRVSDFDEFEGRFVVPIE